MFYANEGKSGFKSLFYVNIFLERRYSTMKIKKLVNKCASHFAAFALLIGVISTSATCRFLLHQPEVPEKMKKIIHNK